VITPALSLLALIAAETSTIGPVQAPRPNREPAASSAVSGVALPDLKAAAGAINTNDLMRHIRVLASDEFEGRLPGGRGEELTVNYLIEQFRNMGLEPGNPNGSWTQAVPLAGVKSEVTAALHLNRRTVPLQFPQDMAAWSPRLQPQVEVEQSQLVFVGYGIQAPEYGWDDFKGLDVRGKTLLMLVGDPPLTVPNDPSRLDESMFKGKAMTYYGRWTYKFEIAAKLGAAAAFVIHETGPAGYPWFVVVNSWGRENFSLNHTDKNQQEIGVAAWMSLDRTKQLFADAGMNFDQLKTAALNRGFKPVPLPARIDFKVQNKIREVDSRNVIAKLSGSDPQRKDEHVIYTAHWDHLGKDEKKEGDQIFNGAVDNASGAAALLEFAKAFRKLPKPPSRSVLFLSVTAEEQGLLGAKFYARHPLFPLEKTLANINVDTINPWGRTRDLSVIGLGQTTLDDLLADVAAARGITVKPEPTPEKGFYYRSDHFEFAKEGVPALYIKGGEDYIGKPADFGRRKRDEYTAEDYHKVSDEVKSDWDLAGAVEDLRMLMEIGYRVAEVERWPEWKPGSEFKKRREPIRP
jgi:Zn-dependent M28 family amino/carboxypeptidase